MEPSVRIRERRVLWVFALLVSLGCASVDRSSQAVEFVRLKGSPPPPDRKIVRSADLTVEVNDPSSAMAEVERLVTQAGGLIEGSTVTEDSMVSMRCRVPAAQLDQMLEQIAALGDEKHRSVHAQDVTDQYTDLETRLRNNLALRDRLQALLERAQDVEDVLAIEKELTRIQSEVETMQAQFDRLQSQVELSSLSVSLQRKRILGPLGYLGQGLWWAISKLFVIR